MKEMKNLIDQGCFRIFTKVVILLFAIFLSANFKSYSQFPGSTNQEELFGNYACPGSTVINANRWGNGTKYYVKTNGSNSANGLSEGTAWATLDHAVKNVPANQDVVIVVKAGTYNTPGDINVPLGVSILGETKANGDPATLLNFIGPDQKFTKVIALNNIGAKDAMGNIKIFDGNQFVKNIHIKGNADNSGGVRSAAFSGAYRGIMSFQRNNILVDNCIVEDTWESGIRLAGTEWGSNDAMDIKYFAKNIEVSNCKIYRASSRGSSATNNLSYSFALQLFRVTNSNIHNNKVINWISNKDKAEGLTWGIQMIGVENCNIYRNEVETSYKSDEFGPGVAYGVAVTQGPGSGDCLVCENISNNYFTIDGDGIEEIYPRTNGWNIVVFNNSAIFSDNTATQNVVAFESLTEKVNYFGNYINNAKGGGFLQWFWEEGSITTGQGSYIHHNVFTDTIGIKDALGINFSVRGSSNKGFYLYNNTFDGLKTAINFLGANASHANEVVENIVIQNNIFMNCDNAIYMSSNTNNFKNFTVKSNNDFSTATRVANNPSGFAAIATQTDWTSNDPGLRKSGNRSYPYYEPLSASSFAVDQGTIYSGLSSPYYLGSAPDLGAIEYKANQSTNANLATLTTSQGTLSPAFTAATTSYTVNLPTGTTTVPTVSATAADAKATVAIIQAANLTGSAAQRTATVVVTAEDGTTKTYTVVFSIESATPDFTLNASNTNLNIPQGAFGTTDISFTPSGGFSGAVALSIDASTPLPAGVTATFTPPSISSGSSTLRFDVDATAAPVGPVSITVRGVSGSISKTVGINLTITEVTEPTFTLNASPQSLTIAQGGGGEIDVTITALAGFDQEVDLTYNLIKAGVSASFNPAFISGEGESLLSIIVEEDADLGAAELTITATSGTIVRTVSISLQIEPPPVEIYPANQFSPNGDGIDDTWQITDIEKAPQLVISVFNRVGQVVFRTKAYQNDWDGTSNGRQLLPATYFYVIRNEKGENVKTGSVNLIR